MVGEIKTIKSAPQYRLASFDTTDLYTYVPVEETITIFKEIV